MDLGSGPNQLGLTGLAGQGGVWMFSKWNKLEMNIKRKSLKVLSRGAISHLQFYKTVLAARRKMGMQRKHLGILLVA